METDEQNGKLVRWEVGRPHKHLHKIILTVCKTSLAILITMIFSTPDRICPVYSHGFQGWSPLKFLVVFEALTPSSVSGHYITKRSAVAPISYYFLLTADMIVTPMVNDINAIIGDSGVGVGVGFGVAVGVLSGGQTKSWLQMNCVVPLNCKCNVVLTLGVLLRTVIILTKPQGIWLSGNQPYCTTAFPPLVGTDTCWLLLFKLPL